MEQKRSCGTCTACCKTHAVPSIEKPPHTWCTHCKIGTGCGIYNARPEECADFTCMWLEGEGRDEDRPDMSKCVVGVNAVPHLGDVLSITDLRHNAHKKAGLAQEWIRKAIGLRMKIYIEGESGRARLLIPPDFILSNTAKRILIESDVAVHRYRLVT
jgi:hypothetical protein